MKQHALITKTAPGTRTCEATIYLEDGVYRSAVSYTITITFRVFEEASYVKNLMRTSFQQTTRLALTLWQLGTPPPPPQTHTP